MLLVMVRAEFGVSGLGFSNLRFRVEGLGFRVQRSGFRVRPSSGEDY